MSELVTARLRLEPWAEGHAARLARLAAMPEVVRHVGDGAPWDAARSRDRHERALAHWAEHGFGWRAMRAPEGLVGLAALNVLGDGAPGWPADAIEIGWWVDPACWGRGYASESARALRASVDGDVVARIQHANLASQRVAEAIGLRRVGESTLGDMTFLVLSS